MKRHQPYHLYLDNYIYFFTAHTYDNLCLLNSVRRKNELKQRLKEAAIQKQAKIIAWVILDNHYHLLMKPFKGRDIKVMFHTIHGATSFKWNKEDDKRGRRIWQNYWDRCVRDEKDYWTHFNYVHHNPVKHGYLERMEDYEFSSLNYYIKTKGYEWVMSVFEQYPVVDFSVDGDEGDKRLKP